MTNHFTFKPITQYETYLSICNTYLPKTTHADEKTNILTQLRLRWSACNVQSIENKNKKWNFYYTESPNTYTILCTNSCYKRKIESELLNFFYLIIFITMKFHQIVPIVTFIIILLPKTYRTIIKQMTFFRKKLYFFIL